MQGVTFAQLTSGVTSTSNAFDFSGRLQDYASFLATFSVKCSGRADAIYFYFGGIGAPASENDDSDSKACVIGLSLYNNLLQISMNNPSIKINLYYDVQSQTETWIPINIIYQRTSDSSFNVGVTVSGSTTSSTSATASVAGAWFTSSSGVHWGIGARTGASAGTFSFKDLAVIPGGFERLLGLRWIHTMVSHVTNSSRGLTFLCLQEVQHAAHAQLGRLLPAQVHIYPIKTTGSYFICFQTVTFFSVRCMFLKLVFAARS